MNSKLRRAHFLEQIEAFYEEFGKSVPGLDDMLLEARDLQNNPTPKELAQFSALLHWFRTQTSSVQ